MNNLLKDIAAVCTLPILYLSGILMTLEFMSRQFNIDIYDISLLWSGAVFLGTSVLTSVCSSLIDVMGERDQC